MCPMERHIPVAHTPDRTLSVFVYCSCKQDTQELYWEQQLGHFGPTDQNDQVCQNGPPSKLVPNIPVGPNLIGQSSRDVVGHQSVKP